MKIKRSERADPDLGVHPQEGFAAVMRLQPHIQQMIDAEYEIEVVLSAIGEAFFGTLHTAGAPDWQIEKWSIGLLKTMGIKGNYTTAVRGAYEHLGPEITKMINKEGYDPLPIAWALMGSITHIVRRVPGISKPEKRKLRDDLILHIREARQKAA